jgi:hypothetical protein
MNEKFRFLLVGLYAWMAAVLFGGILLDMVYANMLKDVIGSSQRAMVFSEISDTLLCIGFLMVISVAGAIAVSWKSKIARNLLIASLFAFSFEFMIPMLFSLLQIMQELPGIRLLPSAIASILAIIGLYKYCRQ